MRDQLDSEQLPTIVVRATVTEVDKLAAYEEGVDAFIEKPISLDDLEAAIRNSCLLCCRTSKKPSASSNLMCPLSLPKPVSDRGRSHSPR